MEGKISIIVPALNEERTIENTVKECCKAKCISEVIVVDDKSEDNTVKKAISAGARVIISTVRGKGTSMEEGLRSAKGDIIVFVDADIKNFNAKIINMITDPILKDRCDFVKSAFGRRSGRVTELLAKPLLMNLFPALVSFRQPLSGIIAGKKRYLEKVHYENDYGVDIGILIDVVNQGARIMEVDIGYIDHKMKPWRKLTSMAGEVSCSILKRARMTNKAVQEGVIAEASLIGGMVLKGAEAAFPIDKVAFVDIDGTVLKDRFIFSFAKKKGFLDKVSKVSISTKESFAKTAAIAASMKGVMKEEIVKFASSMRLSRNARSLIARLREKGYYIVLITDGYEVVAQTIAARLEADHVIANKLHYEDGQATGEVEINEFFLPLRKGCTNHSICKLNAATRFCKLHSIDFKKTFAIGNSENDACLLRFANVSYAYMPADEVTASSAKFIINDMSEADG